jgi:hypothetical protein
MARPSRPTVTPRSTRFCRVLTAIADLRRTSERTGVSGIRLTGPLARGTQNVSTSSKKQRQAGKRDHIPCIPVYLLIRPAVVNLFSKSGGKIKRAKLPASSKDSGSGRRFALFAKKAAWRWIGGPRSVEAGSPAIHHVETLWDGAGGEWSLPFGSESPSDPCGGTERLPETKVRKGLACQGLRSAIRFLAHLTMQTMS